MKPVRRVVSDGHLVWASLQEFVSICVAEPFKEKS
jgi:hypothetical protein